MARVIASRNTEDTAVTLIFTDGTELTIREEDYPCSMETPDKLYE